MPQVPIPQDCPYDSCHGEVSYEVLACPTCDEPIVWEKDPNRPGGWKPIRPGTGG